MKVFKFCSALLLAACLILPAWAREALTPQEAPDLFFEAVYKMDYVQAWQVLSRDSQERIIKLVLETEKDPRLQTAALRKLFETGDRAVQRGFWTQLRLSMDIETWNKQTFTELTNEQNQTNQNNPNNQGRLVRVMPADITVIVKQENQNWKFGFTESFLDRRKPQSTPKPAPSGAPTQPGGPKGGT